MDDKKIKLKKKKRKKSALLTDEFWRLFWGAPVTQLIQVQILHQAPHPPRFNLIAYWFRVERSIDKGESGSLSFRSGLYLLPWVCVLACVCVCVCILYGGEAGWRKGEKSVRGVDVVLTGGLLYVWCTCVVIIFLCGQFIGWWTGFIMLCPTGPVWGNQCVNLVSVPLRFIYFLHSYPLLIFQPLLLLTCLPSRWATGSCTQGTYSSIGYKMEGQCPLHLR